MSGEWQVPIETDVDKPPLNGIIWSIMNIPAISPILGEPLQRASPTVHNNASERAVPCLSDCRRPRSLRHCLSSRHRGRSSGPDVPRHQLPGGERNDRLPPVNRRCHVERLTINSALRKVVEDHRGRHCHGRNAARWLEVDQYISAP